MHQPDPVFPPLITGHAVRAPETAFAAAVRGAEAGQYGAADLVWARDTGKLDCAVVLEPEVTAERAAEMLFVALVAFGDCFGALAPPEIGVTYVWPQDIRINGGKVGRVRAAMSPGRDTEGAPRWLVIGLDIAIRETDRRAPEPGLTPEVTTLHEEGCGEITRTALLESFARHFLTWVHQWETEGFRPVHDMLLFRTEGHREMVTVELGGALHEGRFTGFDEAGNMLLQTDDGARLLSAMEAVEIGPAAERVP